MLASQGSNESSPQLPPLSAASSTGGGTFFGRGFLRRGRSADLRSIGGGWGPRLHLGGSGKQEKEQQVKPPAGSPGADASLSEDDPSSDGGRRLSAGAFDEQLTPMAGSAADCFRPFGGGAFVNPNVPQRPPSPAPPPALRIAVGRPRSPSPSSSGMHSHGQFFAANAPTAAGSQGAFSAPDNRLSPANLPRSSGGTPRRCGAMSREASADLAPLERHQRGSSAALHALGGSVPGSPVSMHFAVSLGVILEPYSLFQAMFRHVGLKPSMHSKQSLWHQPRLEMIGAC